MRYVVTGAAGFIGSTLALTLQSDGHEVVGVDAFTDYYDVAEREENAAGLDVRRLDLVETELELEGVDGVFHLAGQPGVRSFGEAFPTYVRGNVLATQRGHAHRPSMLEDVEAHRPTEADLINGSLIREAERAGLQVPLQRLVYTLVKAKEASYS